MQLVLLGVLALGTGAAMNLMLGQLKSDFFRAYLPPWVFVSYAVVALGVAIAAAGAAMKPSEPRPLDLSRAGGILAKLALLNAAVAALMLAPVLFPSFRFPILITQWPGIYMVLAYFSFLAVGVLGMAVWSLLVAHLPDLLHVRTFGAVWFWVQVVLTEVGVYGLAVSMFLGGYAGSWLAYSGAGPVVVGAQMEFSVIPSAVSMFLVATGTVMGVVNVLTSGRSVAA